MKNESANYFKCVFPAKSINESFARAVVASFIAGLDPKICDIADAKTVVSEAVTNVIVHAYPDKDGDSTVILTGKYTPDGTVTITVKDRGKGIADIKKALEPLYTTSPDDERSGMGFTVMETLTDTMRVTSKPGKGTTVRLTKKLS